MKVASGFFGALLLLIVTVSTFGAEKRRGPAHIRVLLTYGGHAFQEKQFYALFDSLPGIKYDKLKLPDSADALKPGLQHKYDVIVMYDMAKGFTPEQERQFVELLTQGIGVVSLHHNLCSHEDWPEYGQIIGGRYFQKPETFAGTQCPPSHYLHDQHMEVKIADHDHPITRGLSDFHMDDENVLGLLRLSGVARPFDGRSPQVRPQRVMGDAVRQQPGLLSHVRPRPLRLE